MNMQGMEKLYDWRRSNLALEKKKNLESGVSLGQKSTDDHTEREQCSRVHLDAITSDDDGSVYAFRGEFHIVVSSQTALLVIGFFFFRDSFSLYHYAVAFISESMNHLFKRFLQIPFTSRANCLYIVFTATI